MFLHIVVLGCLLIAVSMRSSPSDSHQAPEGNGSFGAPTEAEKTVVGCILRRNDRFLLINKKHPQGLEIRMAADLNKAVGLQARVKGVFDYAPNLSAPIHSTSLSNASPKRVPTAMKVSSVTYLSGTCDENGMLRK